MVLLDKLSYRNQDFNKSCRYLFSRPNFVTTHCNQTINKWKTDLLNDESKFNMINSDRMSTLMCKSKRRDPRNCKIGFKYGGDVIMV